ncbi:hypothetical protein EX30DRAFT_147599 [Ascodesmis nigricans]|uniref:Uncharacterized protein n=1 Tax=Ascodesmis nigricans TaxID=341454 RepID=A0A4S2N213_9PEZI|nr:hypothetical protein EX30DRAFT_147599 [Ascodesmis nigricans]
MIKLGHNDLDYTVQYHTTSPSNRIIPSISFHFIMLQINILLIVSSVALQHACSPLQTALHHNILSFQSDTLTSLYSSEINRSNNPFRIQEHLICGLESIVEEI